ncbi:MAG: ZIP family metal transporter [Bacilli bacterium]|nr:ZIP family metal transporter [Bacilli bacterium]
MYDWFINLNYVYQALIATLFTYLLTALGASIVFFFKNISKNIMDAMLGFAAGVMTAASFFSLLSPAIEHAETLNITPWIIISVGFFSGGLLLFISDKVFNKLLSKKNKRILMLISSITIHNIPEGLAVGIAFGSIYYGLTGATTISAILLTIGIGLQNFPEGSAVSIPLLREGMSRKKAFFYGQLSAVVEPIFGVIGAILVLKVRTLLPFFLSFAAGAMIYVVISELIPESQSNKKKEVMAIFTIIGFTIMMILDVSLG